MIRHCPDSGAGVDGEVAHDAEANGEARPVELIQLVFEHCCDDWPVQIEKVTAPILLAHARNPQHPQYDGIPFRFCPWCGKQRRLT